MIMGACTGGPQSLLNQMLTMHSAHALLLGPIGLVVCKQPQEGVRFGPKGLKMGERW